MVTNFFALRWHPQESHYFRRVLQAVPGITVIGEPRQTQRNLLRQRVEALRRLAGVAGGGVVLLSSLGALLCVKLLCFFSTCRVVYVSPRYIGGEGESWFTLPFICFFLRFADTVLVQTSSQAHALEELAPGLAPRIVVWRGVERGGHEPSLPHSGGDKTVLLWSERGEGKHVEHLLRAVSGGGDQTVTVVVGGVEAERTRLESIAVGLGMFDRFSIVPTELLSDGEALQEVLTLCSLVLLPPTKRAALFKVVTPLALQIPVLVAPSPEYAEVLKVAELFYDTTNVEALTAQLDELFQGREERERALALGQSALQQYLELPQEKLPILLAE